ncbi:MAG: DUF3021 domain-containing protein [Lachnospiraceae bacterium]|nr:DUF3021 domain-containing protein [Lachnospiraceae bacterium]
MKTILQRCGISFTISALSGLIVNLIIDVIMNTVNPGSSFVSMSPEFLALFPSPVIAGYVNILLYGIIGTAFAGMTVIYEVQRLGLLIQSLIYFLTTSLVWIPITMFLWQLYKYPQALISTVIGYFFSYVIVSIISYKQLRRDISEINERISAS